MYTESCKHGSEGVAGKPTVAIQLGGSLLPYKSRMDGYAIGIQNGFFSVNDVR